MIFYAIIFVCLHFTLANALLSSNSQYIDKAQDENGYLKLQIENIGKKTEEMELKYTEIIKTLETKIEKQEKKLHHIVGKMQTQEETINKLKSVCSHTHNKPDLDSNKGQDDMHKNGSSTSNFLRGTIVDSGFQEQRIIRELTVQTQEGEMTAQKSVSKRVNDGNVAFAASLYHTLDHGAPGHVIAFDHVYINEGNGYNGNDGIFVCPISGLYLFSVNIFINMVNKAGAVYIVVNGADIVRTYTNMVHQQTNAPGTTVVRLNAGDHVWVRISHNGGAAYGNSYSHFTGVLIRE